MVRLRTVCDLRPAGEPKGKCGGPGNPIGVAVIGIPHDKWGEVGRAFIVLKEDAATTPDAILAHCRSQLARYKVPAEIRVIAELPHNATGKVTKHALPKG